MKRILIIRIVSDKASQVWRGFSFLLLMMLHFIELKFPSLFSLLRHCCIVANFKLLFVQNSLLNSGLYSSQIDICINVIVTRLSVIKHKNNDLNWRAQNC